MGADSYDTILFKRENNTAWVTLNRPEVHNAFNADMIRELNYLFGKIHQDESIRVVVITGNGKSFCAGADLNWLREIINYSFEKNLQESLALAELLQTIYTLPKPTIAMVNGTAIGGGTGLLSACDIAVAVEEAKFGLSEVKLGLVPAAIATYIVSRIGESKAREYFLTGKRISAAKACEIGLINEVVSKSQIKTKIQNVIDSFLTSGPKALAECKELLLNISRMNLDDAKEYTARMIADLRVSQEGQEGMSAFLEKRKPNWDKS